MDNPIPIKLHGETPGDALRPLLRNSGMQAHRAFPFEVIANTSCKTVWRSGLALMKNPQKGA
jgi:hypothetical protein